jgi:hypothetical protein
MAIESLDFVDDFATKLRAAGFAPVERVDKLAEMLPSTYIAEALGYLGLVAAIPLCAVGLLPGVVREHAVACTEQRRLFRDRTFTYCIFSATRPAGGRGEHDG